MTGKIHLNDKTSEAAPTQTASHPLSSLNTIDVHYITLDPCAYQPQIEGISQELEGLTTVRSVVSMLDGDGFNVQVFTSGGIADFHIIPVQIDGVDEAHFRVLLLDGDVREIGFRPMNTLKDLICSCFPEAQASDPENARMLEV